MSLTGIVLPRKSLSSLSYLGTNVEFQDPPATITVDRTVASVTSASTSAALVALDLPSV